MDLFDSNGLKAQVLGYANADYLSNPHKAISQPGMFLITMELLFHGDLLSRQWWPPSNHSEILAIHEASSECI